MESLDSQWQVPVDDPLLFDEWEHDSPGKMGDYFTITSCNVEMPTAGSNETETSKLTKKPRGRPRIHADPATQVEVSPESYHTLA